MHMHDVHDGRKDHLALGAGELDISKYRAIADAQQSTVVVEVKTVEGLRQSVQWLHEKN